MKADEDDGRHDPPLAEGTLEEALVDVEPHQELVGRSVGQDQPRAVRHNCGDDYTSDDAPAAPGDQLAFPVMADDRDLPVHYIKVKGIGPWDVATFSRSRFASRCFRKTSPSTRSLCPLIDLGRYGATRAGPSVVAPTPRMIPVRSVTVRISHPLTASSLSRAQVGAPIRWPDLIPKGPEPPPVAPHLAGRPDCRRHRRDLAEHHRRARARPAAGRARRPRVALRSAPDRSALSIGGVSRVRPPARPYQARRGAAARAELGERTQAYSRLAPSGGDVPSTHPLGSRTVNGCRVTTPRATRRMQGAAGCVASARSEMI